MARKRKRPDGPSAYGIMWLVVMFDLPVGSRREMKLATRFRNSLLELGFMRKQFSVYMRHCENMEKAQKLGVRIMGEAEFLAAIENGEMRES